MRARIVFLIAGTALGSLRPAAAQAPARELVLDVRPFVGSALLGWRAGERTYAGVGLGLGFEEFGKTLSPSSRSDYHTLDQLLFVDAFARIKAHRRVDVDVGARGGIGEVRNCAASDCWPGLYIAAYAGVFAGGTRWKIGPRLVVARVSDAGNNDTVIHVEVVLLRVRFGW